MTSKKSQVVKANRYAKWEKAKVDKAVNQLILANATELTKTLIEIAVEDRNPNAINSLLDRAFGKARQNIGLDGGAEDKPIVFMPAQLMAKYNITPATYTALPSPTDSEDDEPVATLIEPIYEPQAQEH